MKKSMKTDICFIPSNKFGELIEGIKKEEWSGYIEVQQCQYCGRNLAYINNKNSEVIKIILTCKCRNNEDLEDLL